MKATCANTKEPPTPKGVADETIHPSHLRPAGFIPGSCRYPGRWLHALAQHRGCTPQQLSQGNGPPESLLARLLRIPAKLLREPVASGLGVLLQEPRHTHRLGAGRLR